MITKKRALIILTPGFAVNESDSTCLPFLQTFLRNLKENYSELNIIVLAFQYPLKNSSYRWHGIEVTSFRGYRRSKIYKVVQLVKILNRLKKLNRGTNIIGLLSLWCNECAWIGKRFSKKNNLKHYCWIWGQDARPGNKYVRRIHPSENELIALSDFLRSEFEKNYSIRPEHVIPPGIDYSLFPKDKSDRTIDILGVGSLIPLKQYGLFLKIISELKKSFPQIHAVLCGKGPEEYSLKIQSEQLGLQENILFTGELSYSDVLQLMSQSKILLHPSSYEGFSGVCQEALFAGAHVISFCRAMNTPIKNWHIVKNMEEMTQKSRAILNTPQSEFTPILEYPISQTSKKIMNLFGL